MRIKALGSPRQSGKVGYRLESFHLGVSFQRGSVSVKPERSITEKKQKKGDKENAMLCPSCAERSLFCQELTKADAVKEVKEDKDGKRNGLAGSLAST